MFKPLLLLQCFVISLIAGQNSEIWDKDLQDHITVLRAAPPAARSDPAYRLPVTVYPLDYDIDLDLNFEATASRAAYSYNGKVTILIQAVAVNVTQIVLHANIDRINSVTVLKSDAIPVSLNNVQPMEIVPLYHFLKINLNEPLEYLSNYTLVIDYSSTMNEGPLRRGIWRGQYIDGNGTVRTYATTHFQPYNARQAFPCWDEPGFKSTFTLHLTVPTSHGAVYSNTKLNSFSLSNGHIRDTFSKTPLMSSYLLTFLVSESFQVIAEDTSFNPPIRVIGRSNAVGLGDKALEWAVGMTRYFNEYFGIPYESMDSNLNNDHISSPDWASAGTENWGMISYRELYMVLDSQETIMSVEHYAATLVSHELAHKWFGNLITCDWWGNTWINEGFASYFGYIATSHAFPEYEHQDHFNARYMHTSLATDSALSPSPLNHDVSTPLEVTGHFGTISYSKGAAFLRMMADMISPETFRKACQYFLTDNSFRATSRQDLYNAFVRAINEDRSLDSYPNFNFEDYYYTWVDKAGYPVLNVLINYNSGEISLSQERFFLSASASATNDIYPIPITYTTESNPDFSGLTPTAMMSGSNMVLTKESGEEWVIFNKLQHGHYRVNYDERSWELLRNALLNNRESIHYLNRGAIVDDIFAFMRSGRLTYSFGLRILSFLSSEINYHVWEPAITGYTWLRNRLRHLPDRQAEFDNLVLNQMEAAIQHVGYDVLANETPTTSQLRQDLLHFACLLKHQRCVEESRTRFLALKNGSWIDPRIRRNVYVVGIRDGDSSDFDFLMNRFLNSNMANDQLEMMRALAATKDPVLLERYMEFTLTNAVRQHDKTNSFNYALLGNNENAELVLQFLMNNIDRIRASHIAEAPSRPVHTVMSNMAAYLDESGLVQYENWLRSTQANSAEFSTAISGITSARSNMAWGTANADNILSAARGGSSTIIASFVMLVTVSMLALIM